MSLAIGPETGEAFWSESLPRHFMLLEHREDLLGEPHGFGCLPFDSKGRLHALEGQTWLYSTFQEADGRWTSWVRRFDLGTLTAGPARRTLLPVEGEDRAVIHHVIVLAPQLVLALYTSGRGVRAAVATGPEATFRTVEGFHLLPALDWELAGRPAQDCSLEANGGHVLVREDATELVFWQNYDSYRPREFGGDIGWFLCRLDKRSGGLELLDRAGGPLAFRPEAWPCARCGSALSSELSIGGRHAFFYYVRRNGQELRIALALSDDPLFRRVDETGLIGGPLGQEEVVEKFQALPSGADEFLLFYESRFQDKSWHTGLRRYRLGN